LRISHQYHNVDVVSSPMGLGRPVALADIRVRRKRVRLVQSFEVLIQLILGQIFICGWNRSYPIGDWLLTR
jgi:hypothetical protein